LYGGAQCCAVDKTKLIKLGGGQLLRELADPEADPSGPDDCTQGARGNTDRQGDGTAGEKSSSSSPDGTLKAQRE
jgi:hypothetical protein